MTLAVRDFRPACLRQQGVNQDSGHTQLRLREGLTTPHLFPVLHLTAGCSSQIVRSNSSPSSR